MPFAIFHSSPANISPTRFSETELYEILSSISVNPFPSSKHTYLRVYVAPNEPLETKQSICTQLLFHLTNMTNDQTRETRTHTTFQLKRTGIKENKNKRWARALFDLKLVYTGWYLSCVYETTMLGDGLLLRNVTLSV